MSDQPFRVQQVDHIELYVPDQYEAARWYQQRLGMEIMRELEFWAEEGGPLMLSSDDGNTKLALFRGSPPGFNQITGFQRVAFRVSGAGFFQFLAGVKAHSVYSGTGEPVHTLSVIDHDLAYSVYFCDPYGNRYEVTTYEYEYVSGRLSPTS